MTDRPAALRAARAGDLPAMHDLLAEAGLPLDGVREHLDTMIVAERDGAIVGMAGLEVYIDGALLRSVAVRPDWRGLRLGEELTRASLDLARARGCPQVFLLTTTAAGFFPRFGFAPATRDGVPDGVRRSVEFTSACPSSAVVMRLTLR